MKIFIALACFVAIIIADSSEKNSICDKEISVKPKDCCPTLPNLQTFFDTCKQQCNVTTSTELPTTTAATTQKGKRGEKKQEQKKGRGENGKGKKGQWQCVISCVVQSTGIADADGNISKDLLIQKLSSQAGLEWAQIIPNVVTECFDNATAMAAKHAGKKNAEQPEGPNTNGTKKCNRMNGMLLKCVYANTLAQCPGLVDSDDCKDLATKMTQCPCKHGKKESGERGGPKGKPEKQQSVKGKQQGGKSEKQEGGRSMQQGGKGQNQKQSNKQTGQ